MSPDPRGFRWPLQPLRNKREWELESARSALLQAQQALGRADAGVRALELRYRTHAQSAADAMHARLEPVLHREALGYLLQLGDEADRAREELARASEQAAQAKKTYIERQLSLDALSAQREEAKRLYRADESRRTDSEADRDWLSRHAGNTVPVKREQAT